MNVTEDLELVTKDRELDWEMCLALKQMQNVQCGLVLVVRCCVRAGSSLASSSSQPNQLTFPFESVNQKSQEYMKHLSKTLPPRSPKRDPVKLVPVNFLRFCQAGFNGEWKFCDKRDMVELYLKIMKHCCQKDTGDTGDNIEIPLDLLDKQKLFVFDWTNPEELYAQSTRRTYVIKLCGGSFAVPLLAPSRILSTLPFDSNLSNTNGGVSISLNSNSPPARRENLVTRSPVTELEEQDRDVPVVTVLSTALSTTKVSEGPPWLRVLRKA